MAIKLLEPMQNKIVVDAMASMTGLGFFPLQMDPTVTISKYGVFFKQGAAYQVTAGKTCWITRVLCGGTANGTLAQILYGDTAVQNSAAAPTNPVVLSDQIVTVTANTMYDLPLWIPIPASKYPTVKQGATFFNGTFWAFEE